MLEVDVELRAAVAPERQAAAMRASTARLVRVQPGSWAGGRPAGGAGLLVLAGLLLHRKLWCERVGAELVGPGDLLRPSPGDATIDCVPLKSEWHVLSTARVAVLDAPWCHRMAAWPEVSIELTGRALERSRRSVELLAINQIRRLDVRVWLLLWRLADRFGQVHLDGVHLELPLTHQQLAELAGARRPSLSAALARLTRDGRLRQSGPVWVLIGGPPDDESPAP